jgi:hypothetical protein
VLSPVHLAQAEQQLSSRAGRPVTLRAEQELRPGRVARLAVDGLGVPSVVVKVADPDDPSRDRAAIHSELAALELLGAVAPGVAPRLLAAEPDSGLLVLEDLGDGPSLATYLAGDDPARAEAALVAWAAALGTVHAASAGMADSFRQRRGALSRYDDRAERFSLRGTPLDRAQAGTSAALDELGLPALHAAAQQDVEAIAAELAEPGDLLVLTTGDPCPDNGRMVDGAARFFDFEAAAYRHALLDGAHLWIPFPNCWCWRTPPPEVVDRMRSAYRARLVTGCSSVADDARFDAAAACVAGAWLLYVLCRRLPLTGDDELARVRVLATLGALLELPAAEATLPALVTWAAEVRTALAVRWDRPAVVDLPYPAFGGPPLAEPG